jgi:hypothetical protein
MNKNDFRGCVALLLIIITIAVVIIGILALGYLSEIFDCLMDIRIDKL